MEGGFRMICGVTASFSGTGLQSFSFPFNARILGVTNVATQAGGAMVSVNGSQNPSSGVLGGERGILGILTAAGSLISCDFPINRNQAVYIDVKSAGTFIFQVQPT